MANWLEEILLGVKGWVSPAAELVTSDGAVYVLASYAEPASQKTAAYRVSVLCEETPVNNDATAYVLTRAFKNASGVVTAIHPTIIDGGTTASPPSADLVYNGDAKTVEVRVTGVAARYFKWRCVRLEAA